MRIRIIAIGRMRDASLEGIIERYRVRLPWTLEVVELQPRGRHVGMEAEAALIEAKLEPGHEVIALDERGRDLSSREFAAHVSRVVDDGVPTLDFIIGGADGLAPRLRHRAGRLLAFGRATWPHMLVRAMLVEQLYRASTIISGHPYHRD
ncbi:MAG: 23S rRNA (pseudouridine(1915)-N(3))-methyltransferase RlmH [Geminicoccaceae bacterium]|nr:23S rRNA (pseudouridine(1915)-N(3))-methyltransferase RlmH [Geminicoccaceae bacterium]